MEKETQKEINQRVKEEKEKVVFLLIVFLIFIIILVVFKLYRINYNKLMYYFLLLLVFVIFYHQLEVYLSIRRIREFVEENVLVKQIGKLEFWSPENYPFFDKAFILIKRRKAYLIRYSDIVSMQRNTCYYMIENFNEYRESLQIILENGKVFKIRLFPFSFNRQENIDIESYVLNKNKNIKVEKGKTTLYPFK